VDECKPLKTGTSIDVYDAFIYMMFPIERNSDSAQAQGKLDLKWNNSEGNSTTLHAEFEASFQFEAEPNEKGEMKLGDFECKVSVASDFATPYLTLDDLYIGVEYWSTMNVTDDEDEPADAPSDAPSASPADDYEYDAAAPSPADAPASAPAPQVEEEAPAPAPAPATDAPNPAPALSPPPLPPSSPPPASPCSADNMVAGCTCGSQGFGPNLPDNPSASSPLCCDKASKKTVKGAQITSWVTCVEYSPPPLPPPPLPPPPSPPPADVCSKGNFFAGCKKCGITVDVNCPPESTGLCCHKATRVAVKAGRCRLDDEAHVDSAWN
jgi:hypothetical protein